MNTIFNPATLAQVTERIHALSAGDAPRWGTMHVDQMLRHCCMNEEMLLGKKHYPRLFIGRLFGPATRRKMLKDDAPLGHNKPTHPELKIRERGDVETLKSEWTALLKAYETLGSKGLVHPFFGSLTREEIGRVAYKHIDHHLRQFGK